MGNLGSAQLSSGDRFDEEAFLVLFDEFDEDKSGTIDKVEMVQLKKIFFRFQAIFTNWNRDNPIDLETFRRLKPH